MNHQDKYNTSKREIIAFYIAMALMFIVIIAVIVANVCRGEELVKCWVMCKPGSQVNVRRTPSKDAQEVGYLDACDWFLTDGSSSNGFIRAYGIGEYGEGWVYAGYVSTDEPEEVFEQYVCVAPSRVACRRWMNGPKVEGSPWLANLSTVDVFYIADGWACTSRGYIQSEWLEVSPR